MLDKEETGTDTRGLRRDATIAKILDAAWMLARRDGLSGLSLRDLAAEVGMRAPSLYTYFASKNHIYDAMYAQGLRQITETMRRLPPIADPRQALLQRARTFVAVGVADPYRYELIFQRPIPGFVPSPESFAIGASELERIQDELEAAGARGERARDTWRALMNGLIGMQIANEPGGRRWTRLVDEAIEMFLAHFASSSETRVPKSSAKGTLGRKS